MADELTDVEVVALSKAFGESRVNKARPNVPNGKTHQLDFTVRVTGTLTRGPKIADSSKLVTAKLELDHVAVMNATLKKLGIKPADFQETYNAAEAAAIKRLAKEQAKQKPSKVPVKGRDGDINVAVDVKKV